jgi:hypothetical protein
MTPSRKVSLLWLSAALLLYLVLTCYQLGLPGLHYDEAKEGGLNAMELITDAPVTAFRGAGIPLNGRTLPLMVQDYIGALNVYLAIPLLALTGVGVPNLRILPILAGLAALLLLERAISEWWTCTSAPRGGMPAAKGQQGVPITLAGLLSVTLLAASPSYVFWARQGIFVTNLMLPFVFLCLWQGVRWLRTGRETALVLAGLGGGLALYAKLSAVWVVAPFVAFAGGWWLLRTARKAEDVPTLRWRAAAAALAAFVLPLLPLLLFNSQTGGTLAAIGGNLAHSYYGVDNANVLANLPLRWAQVIQVLRGEQFWYLGALHANILAPWLALLAVAGGLWCSWRRTLPPLLLTASVFAASLFTISDLFVTHYVLLQPLLVAVAALELAACWAGRGAEERVRGTHNAAKDLLPQGVRRTAVVAVLLLWLTFDLAATIRYHYTLSISGGLADHSDASYHLAYYLQFNGMGAPIALDWGIDAPVRFLTNGAVTPLEIFGYAAVAAPDEGFEGRLAPFLDNPDNRYLLHAPSSTVFDGRREAFLQAVQSRGARAEVEQTFAQRDGAPLFEIWRVTAP